MGSSCRGAGSCQCKWGPPQVMEQLPHEDAGHPLHRALSPKRRQLVLLKSLNFVSKPHGPMGARRSHARSNGKAVGGAALTQAQLEAGEAGPAARPNLLPSTRLGASGRMLRSGSGKEAGPRSATEAAAGPHVDGAYHACAHPPRFHPLWESASCKS